MCCSTVQWGTGTLVLHLGRPWALEAVLGIHRGVCRLKGQIKAWLHVEL